MSLLALRVRSILACWLLALLCAPSAVDAATLPNRFSETLVASGLTAPTAMQIAPDGRIFVCEQGGALRVIKNGALLPQPFLTLAVDQQGERGLLGVAFDPSFATNRYIYVYYTTTNGGTHNRIDRYTANASNPDVVQVGSEFRIADLDGLSGATNHNGGALNFGPDGKLYIAVGDNANGSNAQTLSNRLGKILRLNADGTIPADNPFYGTALGLNRAIWALGLRNPFTFAFNPSGGRMHINDVGQSSFEEINEGGAGRNFGWPASEGPPAGTPNPAFTYPTHYYSSGEGCAITGGAFYSPGTARFPSSYAGDYFYADFCSGWIRRFDLTTGAVAGNFATGIQSPVDLKVSGDGYLLYLARGTGAVYRVDYNPDVPALAVHPQSVAVAHGSPASFTVAATGDPIRYQWQRNGVDIPGATSPAYTLGAALTGDSGARFRVIVSNQAGTRASDEALLTVTTGPPPPPTGLTAYTNGLTLYLSWNASPGATSYVLEGGTAAGLSNALVADIGNVTQLQGLVPAGTFYARVRAVGVNGASAPSNEVGFTLSGTAACATPPPPPTGYTVQVAGLNVQLSWNASPSATSYLLEAGSDAGLANILSANVGAATVLGTSAPAGVYFTRVRAVNACGVGAPSNEVPVSLGCSSLPPPPSPLTFGKSGPLLTLSWGASAGALGYRGEVGTAPGLTNLINGPLGAVTSQVLDISGVPPGVYYVRIRGVSACGIGPVSNEIAVPVP